MLTVFSAVFSKEISHPISYRHLTTHVRGRTEACRWLLTYAVIAKATMRGTRGPENLAGETIFKFYSLAIDDDFFGSGRWAVPP